jgi:uncharacterized protein YlaN (UPF0358 family)
MHVRKATISALHLIVVLVFFSISLFGCLLPVRPDWCRVISRTLEESPRYFYWVGVIFLVVTFLLIVGFYSVNRGRFLRFLIKPHETIIERKLLQVAIEKCFSACFPRHVRNVDVNVAAGQRLEVAVELVSVEQRQQMKLMKEMERQLSCLLRESFGYTRPFTFSVCLK